MVFDALTGSQVENRFCAPSFDMNVGRIMVSEVDLKFKTLGLENRWAHDHYIHIL